VPAPEDAVREGVETDPGLVVALRQLAYAVRALQLYPPSSQVVSRAVRRAHKTLSPFVSGGRLSLAILPETIRIGGEDVGAGNSTLRSLAECLHQRGVAHLHLDASLARSSLERLAEMLSTDADTLNEQGGIGALCERQQLQGLAVDMLQLDKLYEDEEDVEVDPEAAVWEQILGGYRDDLDLSAIDWETLADDSEQLADFLSWLLDDESPPPGIAEMSRLQVVRTVCERVGAAAAELGSDRLEAVARVVGRFYDKLDKEVWIDVLGQPLEVANSATPSVDNRPPASDLDDTERKIRTVATELAAADLAQSIAETLSRDQAEDLLVYALTSREAASPRIFGLFHRLLEARDERELMERSIREKVERQTTSEAGRKTFEELWPLLNDALHGEHMDAYVSTTYRAQMELLLSNAPLTSLWNIERIAPRMRELEPGYLMQRKAKVILGILSSETSDDDYVALVEVLERSLPELLVDGQYISTEEILGALATDLIPSSGRSDRQREAARDVLIRFCNEHTLREVVRNLAGKHSTQIDAATRIFSALGPMAVAALLEALSHEESRPIRVHLIGMLAAIGDQALPEIRRHLRDKRWFFVRNLVWIIGEIGDPRFLPHLGIIVTHPDVRVRREAVRSMSKLRNETTTKVLLGAVDDTDLEVQLLAIRGLGTTGSRAAVPRLRELLRISNRTGNNTEVVRAAAIALGRIGDGEALTALKIVARPPWLFRGRRIAAHEAARWAVATLEGEMTGEAPEARLRPRQHTDATDNADDEAAESADA